VVTITDLEKNKQIYINTKNKPYAEHVFDQSEFPVIDSVADSKGPQMEIRKTGQSKVIDGRKCSEIYFKLDKSTQTGVGEAKVKHYFEGTMWVTQDIPSYKLYLAYNDRAHSYLRGTRYMGGGFFDILAKLDVDQYNLLRLIRALDGIPGEASFIAQLPSDQGGNVFESKIKMLEVSDKPFKEGHFGFPTDPTFKQVPANEFKSF